MDVLCDVCEFDKFERLEDVGGGNALVLFRSGYFVRAVSLDVRCALGWKAMTVYVAAIENIE